MSGAAQFQQYPPQKRKMSNIRVLYELTDSLCLRLDDFFYSPLFQRENIED